ncbi:hypothetical protein NtB2_00777 [Lactococcus termiticola]|uniref:Uncharacterized protein n=1 Tax=Lactococcus termiticola TaxID=2169526 RepID=A0A2R5HF17_9LACT|nr:hypothetical protein NtB2_00777 [Lactococcus termiticola]
MDFRKRKKSPMYGAFLYAGYIDCAWDTLHSAQGEANRRNMV